MSYHTHVFQGHRPPGGDKSWQNANVVRKIAKKSFPAPHVSISEMQNSILSVSHF